MKQSAHGKWLRITALLCIASMPGGSTVAAIKNLAVVMSTGSKLSDVPLADLSKLCKGIQKAWPDGKSLTLVIKNPESPVLRVVESTPGAVGILDVYSINSSVKVLRVDGKLPFDVGYALKGN